MAAGTPGWVGPRVDLVTTTAEGERKVEARVWLEPSGAVSCDRAELLGHWHRAGIVGRSDRGRLHPADGQAFLDELPFAYHSAYLMAVPRRSEVQA